MSDELIKPADLEEITATLTKLKEQLEERHEAGMELYYQRPREWRHTPNGVATRQMLDAFRTSSYQLSSALWTLKNKF